MAVTSFDPDLRITWRRAALVSLAAVVLAGMIVAFVRSGTGAGDSDSAATGGAPSALADKAASDSSAESAAGGAGGADSSAAAPAIPSLGGPSIVRTATVRLRVRGSFAEAVERATDLAVGAGGFVATSATSSYERGRGSGELTLRVPAVRFDDVRRGLAKLGTLESSDIGGRDVGGQLVDLDARLRALRAEEDALGALLGRAGDIGQILQVRDRLTGVRTEIEQLDGQQSALRDQVALATITVSMHQAGGQAATTHPEEDRPAIVESVRTAVDALVAVVGGMVIVLGALLPFAVLALLAWPLARRYQRRQTTTP